MAAPAVFDSQARNVPLDAPGRPVGTFSGDDKFAEVAWRPGPHEDPVIDGGVAWIGCTIEAVHDAGDHYIVIGRVDELDADSTAHP
ncbi:flavin reductase family protein [Streptomyces sp. NPDC007896]|uniref:flavin reductase family protein n=1 Tax=unclassified Streptomyces TaxID=2593676 RepID=UPI0036E59CBE